MSSCRRDLTSPTSARSVQRARHQDLLLSALFIACGPLLWSSGAAILRDQPELLIRFGRMPELTGIETVEALVGLLAAGSGLLVSVGAGIAVLAVITQQIAHRRGAWRLEGLLAQFSPGFLRRSAALAMGTGLALTASAADSWPAGAAETISVQKAEDDRSPASHRADDSAADAADGQPDSALFEIPEPVDPPPPRPDLDPDSAAGADAPSNTEAPGSRRSSAETPNSDRLQGRPQRPSPEPERVVVRLGDCLWDIAADHLGPDATDWEIAASWPRWYEVNRDRIGADPGVILPGTILDAPPR